MSVEFQISTALKAFAKRDCSKGIQHHHLRILDLPYSKRTKDYDGDVDFLRQLLGRIRNAPIEHDVVFVVAGERFPSHRNVAAAVSPVLRFMLTSGMKQAKQRENTDHDVGAHVWRKIETFIYTGKVDFYRFVDAFEVVECANRFQIDRLRPLSLALLGPRIHQNNCVQVLRAADLYNAGHLRKSAMQRLVECFQ